MNRPILPPREGQSSSEWFEEVDPWLANGGSIEGDAKETWEAHRLGMLLGRLHALYEMYNLLRRDPSLSAASLLAEVRAIETAMRDRRRELAYKRVGIRLVHMGDAKDAQIEAALSDDATEQSDTSEGSS